MDSYNNHNTEIHKINTKLADLEDRSRRNNIKFKGFPENVTDSLLNDFLHQFMSELLPEAGNTDLTIDRAHCIPKPPFLADTISRDVLAIIHFFHIKEKVMKASRANPTLSRKFSGIILYTVLSAATIRTRKQFITLTKTLRNHNIPY